MSITLSKPFPVFSMMYQLKTDNDCWLEADGQCYYGMNHIGGNCSQGKCEGRNEYCPLEQDI